jgi:DUF971 family protein
MAHHGGNVTDAATTSPATIDVERTAAVTITWEDGHVSRFGLAMLRLACPCAGCRAAWETSGAPVLPKSLAITDVSLAGAWGMTPTWNDGHSTGIYSWAHLRAACPCEECSPSPD